MSVLIINRKTNVQEKKARLVSWGDGLQLGSHGPGNLRVETVVEEPWTCGLGRKVGVGWPPSVLTSLIPGPAQEGQPLLHHSRRGSQWERITQTQLWRDVSRHDTLFQRPVG